MKIIDSKDGKIIYLESTFSKRARILNIMYFFCFTSVGIFFIYMPLLENNLSIGVFSFIAFVSSIYLLGAYRFLNKALKFEKIFINKTILSISKSGFLHSNQEDYDIEKISNFRHLDKLDIANHTLAGNTFDYLGFQTEQHVVNEVHGDNRLAFDYENKSIQFGEYIYSWDFEDLEILFTSITGKDFRTKKNIEKTYSLTNDNFMIIEKK